MSLYDELNRLQKLDDTLSDSNHFIRMNGYEYVGVKTVDFEINPLESELVKPD